MRSAHVDVTVDLDRVRLAAEQIRAATGVSLIAVVKADAYGLGAARVADALAGVADEFAYFSLDEARQVGRAGIVLGPPDGQPGDYRELHLRPAVGSLDEARRLSTTRPLLNVDSGMQRFGCRADEVNRVLAHQSFDEAFTHAETQGAVAVLVDLCRGRVGRLHAANTALLNCPSAVLDAVRPGVGLYTGAVRVSARLKAVHESSGKIGYTGFQAPRVGIILAGYSNRLRPAPILINGRRQRVLEVGMNTSFVSVADDDRVGDEVVLLGDGLTENDLGKQLGVRPHEILCTYTSLGPRRYLPSDAAS